MKTLFKKLLSSKTQSKHFSETVQRIGKNNAGFSLVELIVVIAIMAILATVAVIGVSVYIPKAQQANDKQLASDVEKALDLAGQAGDLKPGDYVLITLDRAECGSRNGNEDAVDAAMKAVFGENWKEELQLTWDGWDAGPASDAAAMENVENSTFKRDEMGQLLGQVQSVVDAFSEYMVGNSVEAGSATEKYLQMAGIKDGVVTEENKYAVGNAAVFGVAESISNGLADDKAKEEYIEYWKAGGGFAEGGTLDALSGTAANYACALAWAKYADAQTGGDKYTNMLTNGVGGDGNDQETLINTNMSSVIEAIISDGSFNYEAYYTDTVGSTGKTQAEIDAMAFLSYMDGVTNSSGSILEGNDMSKKEFFSDGDVLDYVENYFDASSYLQDAPDGAMIFIYSGSGNIFCAPDWANH